MKLVRTLLLSVTVLFFYSCDNINEEIYINEDGTGTYIFYSDMVPSLTEMTMSMTKMFAQMDSTKAPLNEDSLRMAIEAKIWDDFPSEIDSILDFSNEVPKEVTDDPVGAEMVKRMTGFMKGGKDAGYVNMGVKYSFKSAEDLEAFFQIMKDNKRDNPQLPSGMLQKLSNIELESQFTFSKNKISRKTVVPENIDLDIETDDIKKLIPVSKGRTIIHLPRKVKEAKGESIVKVDGKTVILEYDLVKSMMGEVNTDFEITMKKR